MFDAPVAKKQTQTGEGSRQLRNFTAITQQLLSNTPVSNSETPEAVHSKVSAERQSLCDPGIHREDRVHLIITNTPHDVLRKGDASKMTPNRTTQST